MTLGLCPALVNCYPYRVDYRQGSRNGHVSPPLPPPSPENALIPLPSFLTPPTSLFLYVSLGANKEVSLAAHILAEGYDCWSELHDPSEALGLDQLLELHTGSKVSVLLANKGNKIRTPLLKTRDQAKIRREDKSKR